MSKQTQTIDSDRTQNEVAVSAGLRECRSVNTVGETEPVPPTFVPATAGSLIGYARVSTTDGRQMVDRQQDALEAAGCTRVFFDRISGTRSERPEFSRMVEFLRPADEVVVVSLDRLGRGGVRQILDLIEQIEARGASLRILDLDVSTRSAVGALLVAVVAQIAAIEVENLRSRTKQGLDSARARGRVGGRPPSLSPAQRAEAVTLHVSGRQTGEIAALLGCSPRTVRRAIVAGAAVHALDAERA